MLKRTMTGACIIIVVYSVLYFSYIPSVILCATAFLCVFSNYELFSVSDTIRNEALFAFSVLTSVGVVFSNISVFKETLSIVFCVAVIASIWMMLSQNNIRLSSPVKIFAITIFIAIMFKAIPELRSLENGLYYLVLSETICLVSDTVAYLVGKKFGKHKLIPKVSPNKTVEGSLAGIVLTAVIMLPCAALLSYREQITVNYALFTIYILCASVVGQFGDLAMSVIKRICRIKDYGNLFPGHGGVLDRFDSLLFSVVFTYLFCVYTGGFIS